MAKKEEKKKKSLFFYKIISFVLIVFSVLSASVILYFEILPNKYLIPLFSVLSLIVIFISYKLNKRTCLFTKLVATFFSLIIILIEVIGIFYAIGTIDFLNNIFDTGYRLEVYNIYVLGDSDYHKTNDLNESKIIIYNNEADSSAKALNKLKKKVSFEEVNIETISDAVNSLAKEEADALFISESLMHIYKEDHEEEYLKLRLLDTIEVLTKNDSDFKTVNVTKKSFVIYLSGSDLEGSINKVSRSDVNLLAVVNPATGKVLLINTPRDYYVNLPSKNAKDKLTHAGIYGASESAKSLADLYGVDVNYFARVNFTSFVKIIDAIGGIEVESKYAFSYDGSTFKKGTNKVNGKQALAFSRARKMLPEGDISRGFNQQAVLVGIIKKLSSDTSLLTKYATILKSLESGLLTNIDKNMITKLVNMQLKDNIKWEVESYSVKGKDSSNTTYSTGKSKVYVMEPDLDSVTEAKLKIKAVME